LKENISDMKNLYILFMFVFTGLITHAQIVTIPDTNFKARLLEADSTNYIALNLLGAPFKIDSNADGEIQLTEALQVKSLSLNSASIASLTGITSFTNLQVFHCISNQISSLDLNGLVNLQNLDLGGNHIAGALDLTAFPDLVLICVEDNQLTSLNISGLTHVQSLRCRHNQIPSLNLSGYTNLTFLDCAYNQLSSLDLSGLTNIDEVMCQNNQIASLDSIVNLVTLRSLDCDNNQLTSLNLTNLNLQLLYCGFNQIPTLNIENQTNMEYLVCCNNLLSSLNINSLTNLWSVNCENNEIATLDVSNLTELNRLYCYNNQLTTLDLSNAIHFQWLYCYDNNLSSLFLKNGCNEYVVTYNNPNLEYICADESQMTYIQNMITNDGLVNCHVNSYCSYTPGGVFYTIQGNNRYDENSNGCDVSDIDYPNLKLSFTDGTNSGNLIADTTGAYHYDIQAGTHTITPALENPTYFNVSPLSASVTFPPALSPYTQNFCISANGAHNDLEIVLLPINAPRPGIDVTYRIIYKNKGTGTQSGSVNLAFNDSILDLVNSTPSVTTQTTNNLQWNFSDLEPFEAREIIVMVNLNSPTEIPAVIDGDFLSYTATIAGLTDETPIDNSSSVVQIVRNSFDPNDKTCLEGTTVSPDMIGKYVHYIIRFENTGSANAENIVVKDMIDTTKFDITSLMPVKGSHPFLTRITATNKVEFIFENIDLPFDDASNDGYVAFKIKTKPTLVTGNTFSNSAAIYFDYNFPIITNNYTTTIQTLGNFDLEFNNVFSLSPVPTKDTLTITAKQTVEISSVNIYNSLGQLVQVYTNPGETIDVAELKTGSYFIKILTDKGTAGSKFIKE
jgi:Leucine-rich repeat (LRR) protein